jgi:hypothetical protein
MTTNRARAAASGKVRVKKLDDDGFVHVLDPQSPTTCPLGEVGNAAHAIAEGVRSIATLNQVLLVRINVGGEWPLR